MSKIQKQKNHILRITGRQNEEQQKGRITELHYCSKTGNQTNKKAETQKSKKSEKKKHKIIQFEKQIV